MSKGRKPGPEHFQDFAKMGRIYGAASFICGLFCLPVAPCLWSYSLYACLVSCASDACTSRGEGKASYQELDSF